MGEHLMRVNEATKLLALSFTTELIKKRRKKTGEESYNEEVDSDTSDVSFAELESDYRKVLATLEGTPEVRESIVGALKKLQSEGKDLNELYPSSELVKSPSIKRVLFLDDEQA